MEKSRALKEGDKEPCVIYQEGKEPLKIKAEGKNGVTTRERNETGYCQKDRWRRLLWPQLPSRVQFMIYLLNLHKII